MREADTQRETEAEIKGRKCLFNDALNTFYFTVIWRCIKRDRETARQRQRDIDRGGNEAERENTERERTYRERERDRARER